MVTCISSLLLLLLNDFPLHVCNTLKIPVSTHGHLSYFHSDDYINSAAKNIAKQVFVCTSFHFLLWKCTQFKMYHLNHF
jgi:hypothetical protein